LLTPVAARAAAGRPALTDPKQRHGPPVGRTVGAAVVNHRGHPRTLTEQSRPDSVRAMAGILVQ